MPTAAPAVLHAARGLCLCSDCPVPARDPSPKFATGPLPPSWGNQGTRRFCGVCGMFPPHAWGCPAHEKQPDVTSCHPSPQTVAPSLCPGVPGLPLRCLPLLLTPAVHRARAHSHTNVAGRLVGDAANPPSVSSQLPWGHVLVPMGWGEQQPPLLQGTLKSRSFHCLARDKPSLRVYLLGNFPPSPMLELSFALEPGGEGILEQEQLYLPGDRNP